MQAMLALEDGTVFEGKSFGAEFEAYTPYYYSTYETKDESR